MPSDNELTTDSPESRLPRMVNESVMQFLLAAEEAAYQLYDEWDHGHLFLQSTRRTSKDAEFVSYGLAVQFLLCPSWMCGAPDDGGISAWSRWLSGRQFQTLGEASLRSDEQMAAAAIQSVTRAAQVEKLKEGHTGGADFLVTLPDQSRAVAEVTMHTDPGRRRLNNVHGSKPNADLDHDWHLWIRDQRFPGDYGPEHAFPLKEVRELVTAALVRLEQGGADLDQIEDIEQFCEQEIDRQWQWSRGQQLEDTPPLGVTVAMRQPAPARTGRLDLKLSTAIHHFSQVTETAAVVAAVQECIDHKLAKNQWGDASEPKWLVVVLDEGEAATQLRGVEEFEEEALDFSGVTFTGLDEVWAVAFDEGRFTVLRYGSGEPRWRLYRSVEAVIQSDAG
ncbi:MAG: hypothetical protein F4X58_10975 [Chloroflexi bacterium]|nr:hypothetical protein [Chloroflexota bacterium]